MEINEIETIKTIEKLDKSEVGRLPWKSYSGMAVFNLGLFHGNLSLRMCIHKEVCRDSTCHKGIHYKNWHERSFFFFFLFLLVHMWREQACVRGDKHMQQKEFSLGKILQGLQKLWIKMPYVLSDRFHLSLFISISFCICPWLCRMWLFKNVHVLQCW